MNKNGLKIADLPYGLKICDLPYHTIKSIHFESAQNTIRGRLLTEMFSIAYCSFLCGFEGEVFCLFFVVFVFVCFF